MKIKLNVNNYSDYLSRKFLFVMESEADVFILQESQETLGGISLFQWRCAGIGEPWGFKGCIDSRVKLALDNDERSVYAIKAKYWREALLSVLK